MAAHYEARNAFATLLSESSPTRALLVRGASQTGKSHLSRLMTANAMSLPAVVCGRLDFKGTTDFESVFDSFLHALYIEFAAGNTLLERLTSIFTTLRRRARPTVLVFDTYEAGGEAREWIEGILLPHLHSASWLRVVLIGQTVPSRVGMKWESVTGSPITLLPPEPEQWFEYARTNRGTGVALDFVTAAHQLTDGNASILGGLLGPDRDKPS